MPTPIHVLSHDDVMERVESGLMIPMHQGEGLRLVDCGDDRNLTAAYYALRVQQLGHEVSAGRFFGASSGLALGALVTFAATEGEQAVASFVERYNTNPDQIVPEGFVNFSSDLSNRAATLLDVRVDINQHSADGNEENPVELAHHRECDNPLGCAFATYMGAILLGASRPEVLERTQNILAEAGTDLPIKEAAEGITVWQQHIPEGFGIHRGALHYAQTKSGLHTPIAMHEGHHAPNEDTALIIDLAGYRNNANLHNATRLPRYHHTPGLASELLPRLVPEIQLDSRLLEASALLLGESTRLALSGAGTPDALRVEVIPPESAAA